MKNVAPLIVFCLSPIFSCIAQEGWQNYNTGNSQLLTNSVSYIVVDHNNSLWAAYAGAGGNGSGVVKFTGATWIHYNSGNSGLPNNDVRSITVDPQGNLWFSCYNAGIVKFDGTTWTPYNTSNSGIAGNDAGTIAFDNSNNLWVACYSSGVSKFNGSTWFTYTKFNAPFPDNNCINTVAIDKDNKVWVGLGCAGGLAILSQTTNTWQSYTTANSDLPDHTVNAIFKNSDGKMWLAFHNNFVSSVDGTTWTTYTPQKKILGFGSDKDGKIWGYGNGLFKLEGSSWFESTIDGAIDNWGYEFTNRSLAVAKDGRFWLSLQQKGLWTNSNPTISTFERTIDAFDPVYAGKIKWADLDKDLDLDILYCGNDEGSPLTMVYENANGSFAAKTTSLPNLMDGSFATGDYDKDGDVDILLSGWSGSPISRLYRNNGNFSFTLMNTLPGLVGATASWMDLDNDQDLDFLLAGWNTGTGEANTYVYENKAGLFEQLPDTNIPKCAQCALDWADINGDGFVDLLISGLIGSSSHETSLYLNNKNKTFTRDTRPALKSLYNGNVTWGDFDNDNDKDALISGFSDDAKAYSLVYENINGVLEERTDIKVATAAENWWGGTAWADFNSDGNLDIVITGREISQAATSYGFKIFLNDGLGQFSEAIDADFPGVNESSVDCADFDGDGDPDISFLGLNIAGKAVTNIYENRISEAPLVNIPPRFDIPDVINVDEDFQAFKIKIKQISVPPWEQNETITYTLAFLGTPHVMASVNAFFAEISFSSIPNDFGNSSFQLTANDGQLENNVFSKTVQVNVFPTNGLLLSAFEDIEIEFNSPLQEIPFTVQDKDQDPSDLIITATSSNNALVKDSNITISGSGENRIIKILPENGASGETTITVRVNKDGQIVERQFKITVINVTAIERPLSETIHIFPNPVTSSLTVVRQKQITKSITIVVSDIRGSEVKRLVTSDDNAIIDFTNVDTGLYLLRIIDEKEISRPLKVIKR